MRLATIQSAQVPPISVWIMASVLHEDGIDSSGPFSAAGLDRATLSELSSYISATQELAFQRAFAGLSGPRSWTRAGLHYRLLSYGAYGLAILTSSSFRHALSTATRDDLSYTLAHFQPIEVEGVLVGLEADISEVPDDLHEFTLYRDAASVYAALQDLWGGPFPLTRVELALPAPADRSVFEFFNCELTFGAPRTAYYWKREVNDRALMQSDPVLHEHYGRIWASRMPTPEPADELVALILQELRLKGGAEATLPSLARRLGCSERTLQRRLRGRGVTFRDVVSEARKILAIELLTTSDQSITEISYQLGYAELASFNHAFRRWTGTSPRQLRRQQPRSGPAI